MVIRKGKCNRCGKCCDYGGKWPCEYLRFDGDIAICNIYENRPKVCRLYPQRLEDVFEGCGFYFEEEGI